MGIEAIAKAAKPVKTRRTISIDCIAYEDGTHGIEIQVPAGMGLFTAFGCVEHAARKLNLGLLTNTAQLGERG